MADGVGLKIGVAGEKEFKDALKDINQNMKVLGSEMQLVSSAFDKNDKSVQAVTARNTVLNKEIDQQKDKIETLKGALANSAETYGENDKRTQAWQIQLNKAQAELNGMERELENNNNALEESAGEFGAAGQEAGKFGDEVKGSGKDADDAGNKFGALVSVLAGVGAAMGAAMAAIGASAIEGGKALYGMATDWAAAGDHIDKASQKMGISAQGFQEWDYILQINGSSIDSLSAGFKTFTKQLDGADDGSKKAKAAFKDIGLSLKDIENMSPEEAFNKTIEALQKMPEGANRSAAAIALLGKSGMEIGPLLNAGAEATEELRQRAHDLGFVMSDEAVGAAAVFTDAMTDLKGTFTGIKNAIGAKLLPGLSMIADGFTNLLSSQAGAGDQIKAGVDKLVNDVSAALPQIIETFTAIVKTVSKIAPQIFEALISAIVENLPQLIDTASTLIMTLVEGIIQALPLITDGALQLILSLAHGILNNLPQLTEAAVRIITELASGLAEALPVLIPAAIAAILQIVEGLIDNLPLLVDAAIVLIIGLGQGLIESAPILAEKVPELIEAFVGALMEFSELIYDAGVDLVKRLSDGLAEKFPMFEPINEKIQNFDMDFQEAVDSIIDNAEKFGKDVSSKIVEVIPGFEDINAAIQNFDGDWSKVFTTVKETTIDIVDTVVTKWDEFQQEIEPILTAISGLFETVFGGIRDFISNNGSEIVEVGLVIWNKFLADVQNFLNFLEIVWLAIWPTLKLAVTNFIEGVQTFFSGFFDTLQGLWDIFAGLFKGDWERVWNGLVTTVTGIFETLKGMGDMFNSVGDAIVSGIWEGIQKAGEWLRDKFTGFFSDLKENAMNLIGAHSPAEEWMPIGGSMAQGVGVGVDENAAFAADAVINMLNGALDDGKNKVQEFGDYLGRDIPIEVATKLNKNASKAEKEAKAMNDKLLKAQKAAEKERYDSAVNFIGEYRLSDEYLALAEMEMWKTLLTQYESDQTKRLKIKQEMAKLEKKLDKDAFDIMKETLTESVAAHSVTTSEIMRLWDKERLNYAEGTEYRKKADEEFYKAREAVMKEQENLFKAQEKMVADMEKAEEKYIKAVEARAQAIYNSFGLFDELKQREDVSTEVLTANLNDQVKELENWSNNLELLAKRGIDEGLLQELREMGVKAAPEIQALTTMSEDELENYTELWKTKHEIARAAAIEELKGLRMDTDIEISKLNDEIQELFDKTVIPALVDSGEGMADGIIEGFINREQYMLDRVSVTMGKIVNQIKKDMDIHSPSRVFAKIGSFLAQGLGIGFEEQMKSLSRAIVNSVPTDFTLNGAVNAGGAGGSTGVAGIGVDGFHSTQAGNTYILQVKMDQVDEVYKLKRIFENFSHNKIVYQGV